MQKVGMGSSSGAGSAGVMVSSSSESSTPKIKSKQSLRTPKTAPRKKSSSQKALMGHKWFKGSPKSRSNQRISKKLLKSPIVEKTVQKPPTPVGVVEFDVDGSCDRVSVYDLIPCTEMDEDLLDSTPGATYNSDVNPDVVNSFSSTPGDKINKNSKLCKSKETPKSRGGSVKSSKSKSKTPNRLSNKNKSSKDLESRRKSPPLCKLPEACYEKIKNFDISFAPPLPVGYIRYMEIPQEELADEVEYDLDEEDNAWLHFVNDKRKEQNLHPVKYADMELLMDRLEKESYFQMQSTGIDQGALIDDDAVCCICMDGECQNSNAILFCDMCNLAVHQECYGVPYIPEGQWLCRRCLQSPSRAVDCALCPNKGGAFKQTDDGRWAHVVCAIWIPEVCFANTVFLEPIDSIGNIPAARWRLVCFICKQKGVGACIQCHKSNCYIAFHVTCAQQAGLCMKMDTVRESSSVSVKKTAYCDNHAPPESDFLKEGDGTPSPRQKMRQARKLLAEKRSAIPVLSIPTIPGERVTEISQTVSFTRKNQFVKRLMAYWKLKRQSRNGVPLLRRLQASSSLPHPTNRDTSAIADPNKAEESQAYYRYWLRLRQDLERARLLCELVRKREKVKKELIHLKCREVEIQLRPFSLFLLNVLEEIAVKDVQEIFAEPVDTSEVPDYFEVVDQPMDFSTIRDKINSFQYNNIDEFEADFNLMIGNCLNYNSKDTVFYRSAVRLRELGGIIIRHARRSIDAIGYDSTTGLHLPERKYIPVVLTDEEIILKVDNLLNDESRFDKPFDKHMELLNDALDDTLALSHPATRKKKYNKVKHEQVRVRRLKHSKLNKLSSSSPLKEKYKKTVTKDNKDKNISNSSLIQNKTSDLSDTDQVQTQQQSQNHFTRRNRAVRSRLSFSQSQSTAKNPQDSLTPPTTRARRTLGPGKRKREPSNPPLPQTLSPSPSPPPCSPPVLRASTTKLKAAQPDQSVNSGRSPLKKSRRVSSAASVDLQSPLIVTPAVATTPIKSLSKNNANSRNTSSTSGSSDGKKNLSVSGTPKSGSTSRLAACLRDRDRNEEQVTFIGNRLRDRDSLSSDKASPFKAVATTTTPSKSPSSISKGGGGIGKSPSATSSPATTNRRDAVLFSKKVNSSPVFNDSHAANVIDHHTLSTSVKTPNSSSRIPSPQTVTALNSSANNKNIKKSTSSRRLTTWLNSNNNNNSESNTKIKAPAALGDAEIEENKYKGSSTSSPPRRNSTRGARNKKACSNLINNNTAMTNNNINNVMTLNNNRSLPPWNNNRNRSFYSEPVNSNCLDRNLSQSESSSVVSPWNHTNTLSSVALTKVNNSNLVASSDVNISSNSNVRKRNSKKKNPTSTPTNANSICTANANNLDKIQVTTVVPASSSDHHNNYLSNQYNSSSNYTPSGSSVSLPNTGRIPSLSNSHARPNTTPSSNNHNNNSRHNAKADSFLVYRSGRDMDSNSEEDDNGPDKEEKVNANSDSDNDDDDDKDSSASASVSASDDDNDGSHDSISATSPRGDNDDSRDDSGSSSSSESPDSSDDGSCSSSATATTRSPSTNSNLKRSKKNSINKRTAAPSSDVIINADDADSSSDSGSSSSGSGSDDSAESTESDSSGNGISNPNLSVINHTNTRGRQPQGQCRQRPATRTRKVVNNAVSVNHKQDKKESSNRQMLSKISRKKTEEKVGVDSHSHDGSSLLLPDPLKAKGRNMKAEVVQDNGEDMEDEEGLVMERPSVRVNMIKVRLEPLDLVWAKCNELEGSWYPALIINPDMPLGFTQNDVPIPGPPQEVLLKRPRNSHENHFLVLCFDNKRTWEWISRNHLEPLGQDPKADKGHLMARKSDKRSLGALRKAYEKALLHRNRVNGAVHGFPNIN